MRPSHGLFLALLLLLLSSTIALADPLPDAPSTSQPPTVANPSSDSVVVIRVRRVPEPAAERKCGPKWMGGCWDYSAPHLNGWQALKSPNFYVPTGLAEAAYWTDVHTSLDAIHRGCVETNSDLPLRPALGDYAKNWAETEAVMDGFQLLFIMVHRRPINWIVRGMATYRIVVHARGIHAGLNCR